MRRAKATGDLLHALSRSANLPCAGRHLLSRRVGAARGLVEADGDIDRGRSGRRSAGAVRSDPRRSCSPRRFPRAMRSGSMRESIDAILEQLPQMVGGLLARFTKAAHDASVAAARASRYQNLREELARVLHDLRLRGHGACETRHRGTHPQRDRQVAAAFRARRYGTRRARTRGTSRRTRSRGVRTTVGSASSPTI